jgi:predicted ATPase/DNA-binding winged helix-turn-helix (wHTH) protein
MKTDPAVARLHFDRFELDETEARLTCAGEPVTLAPKPFAVLCALARCPGKLVPTNALLDAVWGHRFVTDSVLRTAISELRTALDDDARNPRFIETVSRRGYRFIAAATARVDAPSRADDVPASHAPQCTSFIGRAEELARLHSNWDLACAGKRRIVWVAGEPGVGKTTLIDHFIVGLGDVLCVRGQCVDQYGSGEPYMPLLEALTDLSRRDPGLPELIRSVAPTWMLRLPSLSTAAERDALNRELSGAGEARMLREMAELLDCYTRDRPLLLVTKNMHWSDRATVQLMDYVARRRGSANLLWLASFRLTEIIAGDHPLKSVRRELRLHSLADEIVLDAFSEKDVAAYLAHRAPAIAVDETFVRALHDRTDGMPLFVAEVVNDLTDRARRDDIEPTAALPAVWSIPENLTGIVERYVEQLTPTQRSVLEAASVCGAEFRLSTLAYVLDTDVAPLAQACEELARCQRWLKDASPAGQPMDLDARYAFRHSLYREVLYKRISPLVRAEFHRKALARLECERDEGGNASGPRPRSRRDVRGQPMPAMIQ